MVNRIFVERKPAYANEARALCAEIRDFLGIAGIRSVRIINRYDVEGVSPDVLEKCVATVFSEPQVDDVLEALPQIDGAVFSAEYLPGQFDQRADSASQCVQFVSGGARPLVRSAKVYLLEGDLTAGQVEAVKKYVINPVDSREASFELPNTLVAETSAPPDVAHIEGFITMPDDALVSLVDSLGLAMDADDLRFCRDYFRTEQRDPTMTELRMIDTYWSDHCRHTTFATVIDDADIEDKAVSQAYDRYLEVRAALGRNKPVTLMDIATLAAKYLKHEGVLKNLDESDEINACTVKIDVEVDGRTEPWLLLFKNETHNHPTEIEPFGGAATCIGGAIRDPLSGRGYVYQAMRLTGAGDPTRPVEETLPGKLPQRRIVTAAAQGYASYGNQIGVATGLVDEVYHPGYIAKRMEVGAVIAAAPAENVRREQPTAGDLVLLGGFVQPALPVGDAPHEKVPLGILGGGAAQKLLRLGEVSQIDGLPDPGIEAVSGGIGALLVAGLPVSRLLIGALIAAPASAGAHLVDGLIRLIDLFHLLLGQVGQRIVLVVVRVVFPGQFPVSPLDLVVAGVGVHPEDAIWIVHVCFSPSVS